MRKQELMLAILKQLAIQETDIIGEGVVEVLSDGFGSVSTGDPFSQRYDRIYSIYMAWVATCRNLTPGTLVPSIRLTRCILSRTQS
jgi:transcription termination factor Rho